MNKTLIAICLAGGLVLSSCGGSTESGAKKFAPQDRTTSTLSDDEREAAIKAKKAELSVDVYAMMNGNDVKLSVLPPAPAGDITEDLSERIAVKMLQAIAANGIGGVNTVPGFALAASIAPGERKVTSTAPQKMVTTYTLSYKVMNMVTGDVYAASEEEITGVGGSFEAATRNAVNSIKNTPAMKKMLAEGSEKIITWFNENLATFKSQVDAAYGREDYALALSLIESVPQKATEAFEYAQSRHEDILNKFQTKVAAEELTAMKQAMASSPGELSAEVYAHMQMLPKNSPEFKEAQKMLAGYEEGVFKAQAEKEQREIAKAEADAARAHETELATIEAERLKVKYQAKASEQAMRQHMREQDDKNRGFWGNLGARIIGAIDKSSDKADAAEDDE